MTETFSHAASGHAAGAPCPRCQRPMRAGEGGYEESGLLVCASCHAYATVDALDERSQASDRAMRDSVKSAFSGAFGSLAIAVLSFFVQARIAFFLFPLLAVVGGCLSLWVALRRPDAKRLLAGRYVPSLIAAGLAVAIGLVSLVRSFGVGA